MYGIYIPPEGTKLNSHRIIRVSVEMFKRCQPQVQNICSSVLMMTTDGLALCGLSFIHFELTLTFRTQRKLDNHNHMLGVEETSVLRNEYLAYVIIINCQNPVSSFKITQNCSISIGIEQWRKYVLKFTNQFH